MALRAPTTASMSMNPPELPSGEDPAAAAAEQRCDSYGYGEEEPSCFDPTPRDLDKCRGAQRNPRWSRSETLLLIEAKRREEAKWSRAKEERVKGLESCRPSSDSKWLSIAQFCERMGSTRSASQCRKRWCNLSADYKRIRDWGSRREKPSFWLMSNDVRKENKLPGCFDHEVFDSIDKFLGVDARSSPSELIFDSGRQASEDVLFPEVRPHASAVEEEESYVEKEIENDCLASSHDHYQEKLFHENFPMDGYEEVFEEEPDIFPGRRKRKRQPDGDIDIFSKELCRLLENNIGILNSHVDSQNMNCHLDREQRKEQMDGLVHVLGRLAQAVAKIAEKI